MYEYRATVAYIYDADSVRLDIDLGFGIWTRRQPFRLASIDAPELGTEQGRAARDWLRALLPVGTEIVAITEKDRTEKYGRYLAHLYLPDQPIWSVNEQLIEAGHARAYDGGTR
jgi:endonuclease YncB( thermonuclease family)